MAYGKFVNSCPKPALSLVSPKSHINRKENMSKSENKQTAIVAHEYGGPEVLKYEDVQRPEPKDDEILIRVIGAGVNAVDAAIRSGKFAEIFGKNLPFIPGSDIAGV